LIKDQEEKKYYVEEGIVEFSNNKLLILTSTANNLKNFEKEIIDRLINDAEKKLKDNNTTDKEKYIVSYKIDTLREINR
jgi:F0F1-type ATP synthase epsilon subunit